MTRGYTVPLAAHYILKDPELSQRISPELTEELGKLADSKPEIWVPRQQVMRLWSIVDEASPDEETAYRNIVQGGEAVANKALGTFLKLLLRMLSPSQFARKFPDIWAHDHSAGYVEALLGENNTMVVNIRDVAGFAHIGPVAVGFIGVVLGAIGLKDLKLRDKVWTRANPAPAETRIEISWR